MKAPVVAESLLASLPPPVEVAPIPCKKKLVVLDDDPTGTQTVHGVPVLTRWRQSDIEAELRTANRGFFILTNSRALPSGKAAQLATEIGVNLRQASAATGVSIAVVSRGDSTLRGHFPAETDSLATALGGGFAGTILIPALFSGGRLTIGDTHYVRSGESLIPAGETEFARDAVFGFKSSNLRDYVSEKTNGAIPRDSVVSISLEDLRQGGPDVVAAKLLAMPPGGAAIVNAAAPSDLNAFTHALARAHVSERRYLFRTAADFVAAYLAIQSRPLLERADLVTSGSGAGGLLVAGSHVAQTSRQLEVLAAAHPELERIEVNVSRLLEPTLKGEEISSCLAQVNAALGAGRSSAVFTSRSLVRGDNRRSDLDVGVEISAAIVEIVSRIRVRPGWLVAKGGITSSDIATRALGIVRAMVLGQVLPGVPVWACGPECKWPGLSYVVFPGNVGGPDALAQVVTTLTATPVAAVPGPNSK